MIRRTPSCRASHVAQPVHARGFTLIELMIAVAIVAILSAIAYPSYQSYILKSRRADAKNALLDLAAREERVYSTTNTYSNVAGTLGYSALPLAINSSGSSYYQLKIVSATATTYVAQAVPQGTQTKDITCLVYQIDQTGTQSNYDLAGNPLTLATTCW